MAVSRGLMLIMEGHLTLVVVLLCCCCFGLMEASHVVYENLETNRSSFTQGQYRTGYHFQPPMHWINDPNGPMYYNGIYHLFYQYNPKGAVWGNIVWAHSVSTDMINWIPLEPAIYPSKWFDINGCWSGSATILPGKGPVIMYTGIGPDNRQLQNIAVPKDLSDRFLREWVKPDYNPVIDPDSSINATAFRDPTTAWLGPDGLWRLVIGSRKLGRDRGLAVLYKSKDFIHWTKAKHPLHSVGGGIGMWECPDFFPVALEGKKGIDTSEIGDGLKHVLKVSLDLTRFEYYTVGKYILKGDVYVPDKTSADNATGLRLDYGNFYASKTFFDAGEKRRILWGWSNESDTKWDDTTKGWAGIQTIPRSLWLDTTGRQIVQWPIHELESLRGVQVDIQGRNLNSGEILAISGIQTAQADVEVTFAVPSLHKAEAFDPSWTDPQALCGLKGAEVQGGVGPFGLLVLASNDLEERTAVFFRVFKASKKYVVLMCHDTSRSSLRTEVWKQSFGGFVDVDIEKEKKISLRSLVDHSVVESFGAEGKTCMTSRVYPVLATRSGANMLAFNSGLQGITISNLTAWEMHSPLMNQP